MEREDFSMWEQFLRKVGNGSMATFYVECGGIDIVSGSIDFGDVIANKEDRTLWVVTDDDTSIFIDGTKEIERVNVPDSIYFEDVFKFKHDGYELHICFPAA